MLHRFPTMFEVIFRTTRTTNSCESFHSKLNVFFSFGVSKYFYSCGYTSENTDRYIYIKLRSKEKRSCKKTLEKEKFSR
jgi:hypothetical protein